MLSVKYFFVLMGSLLSFGDTATARTHGNCSHIMSQTIELLIYDLGDDHSQMMTKWSLNFSIIDIKNQTVGKFLDYLENKQNISLSSHIAFEKAWNIPEDKVSYTITPLTTPLCEAIDLFYNKPIDKLQYALFVGTKQTPEQVLTKRLLRGLVLDHHMGLFKIGILSPVTFKKSYQPVEDPTGTGVVFKKRIIELVDTSDFKKSNKNEFSTKISEFITTATADYLKENKNTSKSSMKTKYAVASLLNMKTRLVMEETRIDLEPLFVTELYSIVDGNLQSLNRTIKVVELLNRYGWYVPNQFTVGGRLDVVETLHESSGSNKTKELDNLKNKVKEAYNEFGRSVRTSNKKDLSSENTPWGMISYHRVTSTVDGAIDFASFMENVKIEKNWQIIALDNIIPTCKFLLREHSQLFANIRRLIIQNAHRELIRNLQPHLNMMKYMNDIWDEHVQPF